MSSYGDFIALSDVCDADTANLIHKEVSDGIIAPGYTDEALQILKSKRKGTYNIIKIDPEYVPAKIEHKQVYGVTFEQGRNDLKIDSEMLKHIVTENKNLPEEAKIDLVISLITLKYTQSNSVCYAKGGQVIGVGAGQQSRIHCTRLAAIRRMSGICARHKKYWSCLLKKKSAGLNRDNTIVYIFRMIIWMCWPTAFGSSFLPKNPSR